VDKNGQKGRRAKRTKAERRQARSDSRRARQAAATRSERPLDGEAALVEIDRALAALAERSEEVIARLERAAETAERPPQGVLSGSLAGEPSEDLEHALTLRRENVVRVDQPLALICQAQRSGGTLLGRLFDGHPRCHAHPHELHIGERRPHTWPDLALDEAPESWFAKLREEKLRALFGKGKSSIPLKAATKNRSQSFYPFILPPAFQRRIFLDEVERHSPIGSEREILDCYMTSLFNGWLDNQNLYGAEKRWVVAFSPRRAWGEGLGKLFELYPDGRLISILRDPLSWFSSAQGRDREADAGELLEHWRRSAHEMLQAGRRYGDRVCIVRFDELVLDTEAAMRRLAAFLEIDFDQRLTTPTFNGYPVGANSSYEVRSTGVVTDPVERYKELLSAEQQEQIRDQCEELHLQVLALAAGDVAGDTRTPEPISLSAATIGQLAGIEGIGQATARQIVEFRDGRGGISSIEELDEIKNIGPATMKTLRGRLGP
jgi:DNA uptake protein ComE-like DNA-binding protein